MADTITCPECGDEAASMAELAEEHKHEVQEFEVEEDGGFSLYGNSDLYLCKSCKNPLGIRRNKRS